MTTEQWLLSAISLSWSGWMTSLAAARWVGKQETITDNPVYRIGQLEANMSAVEEIPLLSLRVRQLEARWDQAGEKMSDLTNAVQTLPERLRQNFVTREEWDATERRRKVDG